MNRRWKRLTLAAAFALAPPAVLALLSSGSCSLVQLYDGASDGGGGSGGGEAGMEPSPCPPEMIVMSMTQDSGYCIDKLEVTNLAYAKFLAAADAAGPQDPPGRCDWNDSYAPAIPVDAGDTLPVLGVDWCDAYAYCRWANKRLCGKIGSGAIPPGLRDDNNSQWFRACSREGNRLYPYGISFNIAACADCNPALGCNHDAATPTSQPIPVGSKKTCGGGYNGLYDMSGNAAEWEDGCEDDAGVRPDATDDAGKQIPDPRYDTCYHRGGSFYENGSAVGQACLACSTTEPSPSPGCPLAAEVRSRRSHNVGLRCCLDY
jgi:formylglycine-generating enzyme required for sulfatase activity